MYGVVRDDREERERWLLQRLAERAIDRDPVREGGAGEREGAERVWSRRKRAEKE